MPDSLFVEDCLEFLRELRQGELSDEDIPMLVAALKQAITDSPNFCQKLGFSSRRKALEEISRFRG